MTSRTRREVQSVVLHRHAFVIDLRLFDWGFTAPRRAERDEFFREGIVRLTLIK